MSISFCMHCSFPRRNKVTETIEIVKYDGNYYGEGENINLDRTICPHIIQNRHLILDMVYRMNDAKDFDIDYLCYNWYIECNECYKLDIVRNPSYWLSEIVLYLKGYCDAQTKARR